VDKFVEIFREAEFSSISKGFHGVIRSGLPPGLFRGQVEESKD
jgi:hypothetical protein